MAPTLSRLEPASVASRFNLRARRNGQIEARPGEDLGVMELNAAADWLLAKVEAPDAQQRREALKNVYERLEASKAEQPA